MSLPESMQPERWPVLQRGSVGIGVATFQAILETNGYDVTDSVGFFGASTHNATMSFQMLRGLKVDGIVGDETKRGINSTPRTRTGLPGVECLTGIPYVQAVHLGMKNDKYFTRSWMKWIVLHSMEAPESSTTAENVAEWFADQKRAPRASAHYCVDATSIVCSVQEEFMAWHAPGANYYGIGIEHAGYARQTRAQWFDAYSEQTLGRSVWLAARACKRWSIPVQYVDRHQLKAGVHGITTHNEVTHAWGKSTHTDPGDGFPLDWYVEQVNLAVKKLENVGCLTEMST